MRFDEVIWRLDSNLQSGREVVCQECDVDFDEASLPDKGKLTMLIQSLIGQDAGCSYANKLSVLSFQTSGNRLWSFASDGVCGHYSYSVLLTFL